MEKAAKLLTDYVIRKGMAEEEEQSIYEYGFQYGLETALCVLISFVIAYALQMVGEGILFFLIFIPLRSYAGGLHLEHYWSCFTLSCLTFSVILLIVKYIEIPLYLSLMVFIVLVIVVWLLFPVENKNRSVDWEEAQYFKKNFRQILLIDVVIVAAALNWAKEKYLLLITATFLMVVITMLIGKYMCKREK